MIDALLNLAVFAIVVLCIIGFGMYGARNEGLGDKRYHYLSRADRKKYQRHYIPTDLFAKMARQSRPVCAGGASTRIFAGAERLLVNPAKLKVQLTYSMTIRVPFVGTQFVQCVGERSYCSSD